jgi:hypothetical protein
MLATLLAFTLLSSADPIMVYVGPVVPVAQNGFIEPIPEGVKDSVRDVQTSLKRYRGLKLTDNPDTADVVLRVVARREHRESVGAMAVPIGNSVVAAPIRSRVAVVETTMFAGEHSRPIIGVKGSWSDAAFAIAKDLVAWINENQAALLAARR